MLLWILGIQMFIECTFILFPQPYGKIPLSDLSTQLRKFLSLKFTPKNTPLICPLAHNLPL